MPTLADLPPVPGVTHRKVAVRGIELHVAEAGDGPPLVLLHGWPQHWWEWRHLIPRLAERHRVLVPDLRGLGWTSAAPGPYDKRTLALDVLALLDAEGIERVPVVGHDWGGFTAFLMALEAPERVERLVSLDVPPPWPSRPRARNLALPLFLTYQVLLATPGVGEATLRRGSGLVRALMRAGTGRGHRWSDEELDAYASVLREPARARASSLYYRTFLTREAPALARGGDRARELRTPALVVMGSASPVNLAIGATPSERVRVATIPGAGHFLPEEAPDEVLALVEPFLAAPVPVASATP